MYILANTSTQQTDKQRGGPGNIIMAPNGQPMIVGPIRVTPFGTTGGTAAPKKKMDTRNFAERRASLMRDRTKKPTTGTTKPGTKSAPKKTGSSGTSGPPKGSGFIIIFSNCRMRTHNIASSARHERVVVAVNRM